MEYFILTEGPPVFVKARRLLPEKLAAAKKDFEEMEKLGIVRRSNSSWSSSLHVVPKSDGSWRPRGDYHRLNTVLKDDRYPIPRLQDFSAHLHGKAVFSEVDFVRGYYHIPVAAVDVPKTAIITPFGLWEFLRMPFGLKGAAQAFQRMMDRVTQSLGNIFVYLDDILIASETPEQHETDLRTLFQRLQQHGLVVNRSKCVFGAKEIDFLGHRVTAAGIVSLPENVPAIHDFPRPTSVKSLQEFLGMLNYYHRFLPHIAGTLAPLYNVLAGKKEHAALAWSVQMDEAFISAKNALVDATLLVHPVEGALTAMTVDSSQTAIVAVLEQLINGIWRPLGFFSKKLREPRETKYPAFDRELLGAFLATRHFRYFLEGRQFSIYTDHNSLVPAMCKAAEPHNARQANQLSNISEFNTDIRAIEGKNNVIADALSCAPVADTDVSFSDNLLISAIDVPDGVDYNAMAQEQMNDADIASLLSRQKTGLHLG